MRLSPHHRMNENAIECRIYPLRPGDRRSKTFWCFEPESKTDPSNSVQHGLSPPLLGSTQNRLQEEESCCTGRQTVRPRKESGGSPYYQGLDLGADHLGIGITTNWPLPDNLEPCRT